MDGVGHFPWLDAPDRFFAAADTFLQGHWPMSVESALRHGISRDEREMLEQQ